MKTLTLAALLALGPLSAQAQFFTPNTPFTSEDQVLTAGTEVFGGRDNYGGGSFTLGNGVTFGTQFINASYASSTTGSSVSVDVDGAFRADYTGVNAFSDSALNNVLTFDSTGGYGVFNIRGLTAGKTYTVQFFAAMTNNGDYTSGGGTAIESSTENVLDQTNGASGTLSFGQTYNSGTGTYSGTGVYTVSESFIANSVGTEDFFFSSPNGQTVQIAAAEIRETPEPAAYALLLSGLVALVFFARRKSRT